MFKESSDSECCNVYSKIELKIILSFKESVFKEFVFVIFTSLTAGKHLRKEDEFGDYAESIHC